MGRQAILTAIDSQLANIKTADGYNNTLQKHTSGFVDYTELAAHEFPATCVAAGSSNYVPMTAEKYTSGDAIQANDGWLVSTVGYIKAATQEQIGLQQETLIADMIKAILADHHLGMPNYVHNTVLKSVRVYPDMKINVGVVEILWVIKNAFEKDIPI